MTKNEVMQMALDVLEDVFGKNKVDVGAITALRAALEQSEWVGLTDEDCAEVERWVEFKEEGSDRIQTSKLIRYIEEKLRKKNT